MENPMSWTPLHKAINAAYYDSTLEDDSARIHAVLKVVQAVKPEVSADMVEEIVEKHKGLIERRMCGISLCSQMVKGLGLK